MFLSVLISFLFSSWLAVVVCSENNLIIPLFVKALDSSSILPKASIEYDVEKKNSILKLNQDLVLEGKACLGIKESSGNFKCLQLIEIDKSKSALENYIIQLSSSLSGDLSNDVIGINYSLNPSNKKATAYVETIRNGPLAGIKEPIKLVDNKIPEPEVEKTFLQKYWIYLVPLALIFILSGGDQQQR